MRQNSLRVARRRDANTSFRQKYGRQRPVCRLVSIKSDIGDHNCFSQRRQVVVAMSDLEDRLFGRMFAGAGARNNRFCLQLSSVSFRDQSSANAKVGLPGWRRGARRDLGTQEVFSNSRLASSSVCIQVFPRVAAVSRLAERKQEQPHARAMQRQFMAQTNRPRYRPGACSDSGVCDGYSSRLASG
jgi:hypothetical protein